MRPCHNLDIVDQIRIVKESCGGLFGFFSALAYNPFVVATFFYLFFSFWTIFWLRFSFKLFSYFSQKCSRNFNRHHKNAILNLSKIREARFRHKLANPFYSSTLSSQVPKPENALSGLLTRAKRKGWAVPAPIAKYLSACI